LEGSFLGRPNLHPLALTTEHYLAVISVQNDLKIGKSASILLMVNLGLFTAGYIDEKTFEVFKARYSKPLKEIVEENRRKKENSHIPKKEVELQKTREELSKQQLETKAQIQSVDDRVFKAQLEEWETRDFNWRLKTYRYAKKHPENSFALQIIAKAENSDICHTDEGVT